MGSLTISPINAFSDNYIWLIRRGSEAFVVDPGDADPVLTVLSESQLKLSGILITHHHFDHTGGVAQLQTATGCETWGPIDSLLEIAVNRDSTALITTYLAITYLIIF